MIVRMAKCCRACLQGQYRYVHHLHFFITSYAIVIIANFFTVFACMAVLYWKVFRRIRRMRKTQGKLMIISTFAYSYHCSYTCHQSEQNETTPLYGATQAMILEGQKDAKKRVFLFLTVFFITGCVS